MHHRSRIPDVFILNPSMTQCYGVIHNPIEFNFTGRFSSASEITLKIPKRFYNLDTETWQDTIGYDSLTSGNVLFSTDDSTYLRVTGGVIGTKPYYGLVSPTSEQARSDDEMRYDVNSIIKEDDHQPGNPKTFKLQDEVELFDIGHRAGYTFYPMHSISDAEGSEGSMVNAQSLLNSPDGRQEIESKKWFTYVACSDYIPVHKGDVISLANSAKVSENSSTLPLLRPNERIKRGEWYVYFYSDKDPTTFKQRIAHQDVPGSRIGSHTGRFMVPNDGYVRFTQKLLPNQIGAGYVHDGVNYTYKYSYLFPDYNSIKIYSKERRCTAVRCPRNAEENITIQLFIITNTKEENDGINTYKTVTALSYEYSLGQYLLSTEGNTMPFYIPPDIIEIVNRGLWIYDVHNMKDRADTVVISRGEQHLEKGIMNYILDELPGWRIGVVTQELLTRYRTIPEVDDANIYNLLTDTIPKLYNCFIIFDSLHKTISALTLEDIYSRLEALRRDSKIFLTWHNALQEASKDNNDESNYTALRVHAGDDQYGVGLVNPTGNNIIYCFDKLLDKLDFTPEGSLLDDGTPCERTLKQAVSLWIQEYKNQLSSMADYQVKAQQLIVSNQKLIQLSSRRALVLGEYRSTADQINIYIKDRFANSADLVDKLIKDRPIPLDEFSNTLLNLMNQIEQRGMYWQLWSSDKSFWELTAQINGCKEAINSCTQAMRAIARKLVLSPNNHIEDSPKDANSLPLTRAERLALTPYIKMGSWTYADAAFSDTYSADDIKSTLSQVLEIAKDDLDNRLSADNYDFSVTTANVFEIDGFETVTPNLFLGGIVHINFEPGESATPILLEYSENYKDPDDFEFVFTTDPTRKPMQFRFADLYSTITQTSVSDNTFTFDT